jgi:hypothetical protein
MSDIRRIVGSVVHSKAIHVTNEAECGRRYGRNKSTKLVQGNVAEVHNGLSRTGRSQCLLTCDFDFGLGVLKRKKLNIWSKNRVTLSGGCEFRDSGPKFRN